MRALSQLQQASMRGQILRFKEGFAVIDDSYNSNPRALMKMIEVLSGMPSFTRRILIAGEMLELGKDSDSLHFECGAFAASRGLDMVIGIQGRRAGNRSRSRRIGHAGVSGALFSRLPTLRQISSGPNCARATWC